MYALIILTVVAATSGSGSHWGRVEHLGWRPLLTNFETKEECEALAKRIQPVNFVCVKQENRK